MMTAPICTYALSLHQSVTLLTMSFLLIEISCQKLLPGVETTDAANCNQCSQWASRVMYALGQRAQVIVLTVTAWATRV